MTSPGKAVAIASVPGDGNCLWRAAAFRPLKSGKEDALEAA